MEARSIGTWKVGMIGFGAMWLSIPGRPSDQQAIAVIHAALDAGITLIDTADAYCLSADEMGHNERLVAHALSTYGGDTSQVLIGTKGGHCWPDGRWGVDGRPEYLRSACEASLGRLGVESIGLFQFHHPDPSVPFEESIGAIADLQREGKVRMVGISNVSPAQFEAARRIVSIASIQNQFNVFERGDELNGLLDSCQELGVAYLAYSPLGGGTRAKRLGELTTIAAVARRHRVSPQRIALGWLLTKSPVLIPIPGGRRVESVRENAAAAGLVLGDTDLAEVQRTKVPVTWTATAVVERVAGRALRAARRLTRAATRQ